MNKTAYRIMCLGVVFGLAFGASSPALASTASGPAVQGNQDVLQQVKVYYVSTTGKDTNPGTNSAPFKTFAKAVSVLAPGDTLQVIPGTYYESLRITKSGTAAAPISVVGNRAIVNLKGTQTNGIHITGSYVNLSNFEVTGATDAGIYIIGKYVTVKNNNLHNNVTQNGVGSCGEASSHSSAVKVAAGGQNISIENNTVYNNCGEGIAVTRGVNVIVKNNTVFDNYAPNIYIDNSPYSKVQDNLVYCTCARLRSDGTRPTGITLGEEFYDGWGAQMHDVLVSGNTIRDCGRGISAYDSEVGGALTNVTITRNYIPTGFNRAISLTNKSNNNVVISYNTLYNAPWVSSPAGVTLVGNTIGSVSAPTSLSVASATFTNFSLPGTDENLLVAAGKDKDTAGVFRPSNGLLYLKNSNTSGYADIAINYGMGGDYPVVGDWDGNGTDTIGIYRNGSFYLRNSNTIGFANLVFAFGVPGDQPIAGDWNGDGVDTIGVYRSCAGQFLLRNSNTSGEAEMSFALGNVGDVGIAGDWNGDGKDTTGVFRPSNGVIFLKNTNSTGFADIALNYGLPGDQPVMGDWDNDGIDSIGIYRNGAFYLRNSNTVGFADLMFGLGNPGDMPIAGNWDDSP